MSTKLIVALHGPNPHDALSGEPARAALRDAGATRLHLNCDDAPVADALRFGPGEPVTALVSIWTDGGPAASLAVLRDLVDDPGPHAYRVTERVRLDPEPMPDGARADVLANVALLRKPEEMSREEYLHYWLVRHTPIAIRTQNTVAYVQNVVEEALSPDAPEVAAIVEEHFPMAAMHDPHEFYGSRGDDAELARRIDELMASVANFGAGDGLDLVPTSRYCWRL